MQPQYPGLLITFEGGEGCGKSTQVRETAAWLQSRGYEVLTTREPGDTPIGHEIRQLLLSGEYHPVAECELLLFLADRAQHVQQVIIPALARGVIVLCDRYSDSTEAYQLAARQLSEHHPLDALLRFAEQGVRPDLTLWLDLEVQQGLARVRQRALTGESPTRLDEESLAYHQSVRQAFTTIHAHNGARMRRLDAHQSIKAVQGEIQALMTQKLVETGRSHG
ncbi:MAG: dTMP kinase [Zetaproteobacteria bacterium]|nr:dTMP kinase [Zetaproteobacteria bacterium]